MGSLSGFHVGRSFAISFKATASRNISLDSPKNSLGQLILRFLILGLVLETLSLQDYWFFPTSPTRLHYIWIRYWE